MFKLLKKWWDKPTAEELPPVSPEVSCVAQTILNDLEKIEDWDTGIPYGFHPKLVNKKKVYSLIITFNSCYIEGAYYFSFTRTEEKLIYAKAFDLHAFLTKKREEKFIERDKEKVKEIFPECFR